MDPYNIEGLTDELRHLNASLDQIIEKFDVIVLMIFLILILMFLFISGVGYLVGKRDRHDEMHKH